MQVAFRTNVDATCKSLRKFITHLTANRSRDSLRSSQIKGFTDVKVKTIEDNEEVQKKSDVLQTGLKTVKQIGDSGDKEFQETSWKVRWS